MSAHIQLLCRKGTVTHARRVSLNNTNDLANCLWRQTQTSQDTANAAIAAGHIRVRSKINVQHGCVGALHKNRLAVAQCRVQETNCVLHIGPHFFGIILIARQFRFNVNLNRREQTQMGVHNRFESVTEKLAYISLDFRASISIKQYYLLLAEQIEVSKEFANANPIASSLARVGRADSLLGSAQRFASFLSFLHAVDMLMEIEHQMRTVRDYQTILQVLQSLGLVLEHLIEQRG